MLNEILTPHISVVVPIGGQAPSAKYLKSWLPFVDFHSYQIILVEDDLNSNLTSEIEELVSKIEVTSRERLIVKKVSYNNIGKTRNAGIESASGDWIVFWDSDDSPNSMEFFEMLDTTKNSDIVVGQFVYEDEHREATPRNKTQSIYELLENPGIWRIAFKKSIIQNINFPEYSLGEDQVFLLRCLQQTHNITWINRLVYRYHVGVPTQITNQKEKHSLAELAICDVLNLKPKGLVTELEIAQVALNLKLVSISNQNSIFKISTLKWVATLFINKTGRKLIVRKLVRKIFSHQILWKSNLVISLAGGLGNQLFQYSAGLNFSPELNIKFESQLGNPRKNERGLPEIFSFDNQWRLIQSPKKVTSLSQKTYNFLIRASSARIWWINTTITWLPKKVLKVILKIRYKENLQIILSPGLGGKTGDLPRKDTYQIGLYQNALNCFKPHVKEKLRTLAISHPSEELKRWILHSHGRKILIVHVRLGDYLLEPNFGIPGKRYYFDALTNIKDLESFTDIWIFSNDLEEARKHLDFLNTENTTWVPEIGNSASETLQLMREGSAYVIANSTFSWWGAFLSRYENAQVIAPLPWFKNTEDPIGIIPTNWQTLNPWRSSISSEISESELSNLGKFASNNLRTH